MIELTLAAPDDGRTIDVPSGETLCIHVAETPTTGYRWQCEVLDSTILELRDSGYKSADASTVGGGGTRAFELEAKERGITQVEWTLRRGWQKSAVPQAQFTVAIHVI